MRCACSADRASDLPTGWLWRRHPPRAKRSPAAAAGATGKRRSACTIISSSSAVTAKATGCGGKGSQGKHMQRQRADRPMIASCFTGAARRPPGGRPTSTHKSELQSERLNGPFPLAKSVRSEPFPTHTLIRKTLPNPNFPAPQDHQKNWSSALWTLDRVTAQFRDWSL